MLAIRRDQKLEIWLMKHKKKNMRMKIQKRPLLIKMNNCFGIPAVGRDIGLRQEEKKGSLTLRMMLEHN